MVIPYAGILKYRKHIFNNSVKNGDFPDDMKIVSVLLQFSKILERIFIVD